MILTLLTSFPRFSFCADCITCCWHFPVESPVDWQTIVRRILSYMPFLLNQAANAFRMTLRTQAFQSLFSLLLCFINKGIYIKQLYKLPKVLYLLLSYLRTLKHYKHVFIIIIIIIFPTSYIIIFHKRIFRWRLSMHDSVRIVSSLNIPLYCTIWLPAPLLMFR